MRVLSPTLIKQLFAEFSIQQERYPLLDLPATDEEQIYAQVFQS